MKPNADITYRTLSERLLDHVPIGVFVVDSESRIVFWNSWLEAKTGHEELHVYGKQLREVFPGFHKPRYDWALESVLRHNMPQVLSQALNRFLIPIPIPHTGRHGLSMMQQHIHMAPLKADDGRSYAVITIIDVTDEVIRSSVLAELAQKLEHDSNRDPLTDLYNRRFMWEWLLQQLCLCSRFGHVLSCVLLDLDYFKRVNDTWGHEVGDRVLRDCANVIDSELRDADILVRYGGEEFVVFLPHCDMSMAIQTAQRILDAVRKTELAELEGHYMTCSAGVSSYTPENPLTGEELLKLADRRLYEAKNSGRDRVVGGL